MTIRGWHQDEVNVNGLRRVVGGFIPNNTSNPAVRYGNGFTVIRSAVGVWQVTMDEPWAMFFGGNVFFQYAVADSPDFTFSFGAVTRSTKLVEIVNRVAGTKTDITASGTARVVWFELCMARNNVPGLSGLST